VPATLNLPFFDEPAPSREFPVLDQPPAVEPVTELEIEPEPVASEGPDDDGLMAQDRERLEELLDELDGLKSRMQAAREHLA
jgi:hypothetical protein